MFYYSLRLALTTVSVYVLLQSQISSLTIALPRENMLLSLYNAIKIAWECTDLVTYIYIYIYQIFLVNVLIRNVQHEYIYIYIYIYIYNRISTYTMIYIYIYISSYK